LLEPALGDILAVLPADVRQRFRMPISKFARPVEPGRSLSARADGLVQGEIVQPDPVPVQKRRVFSPLLSRFFEALSGLDQPSLPVGPAVLVRSRTSIRLQPTRLDQRFQRDQARVAGMGRLRRVGRQIVVRRSQRQRLPDREAAGGHEIHEPISFGSQIAVVETSGERGRMQQQSRAPPVEWRALAHA
jgi:hypothetical protein